MASADVAACVKITYFFLHILLFKLIIEM